MMMRAMIVAYYDHMMLYMNMCVSPFNRSRRYTCTSLARAQCHTGELNLLGYKSNFKASLADVCSLT